MRPRKISRRRFMRLAGATLGVTAAAPALPAMVLSAAPRGASYGVQLSPFSLADVSLGSSLFRANRDRALSYLAFISADRLLHTFRLNYGLGSSAAACGGWEGTASGLRGHSMGHFLVGLCQAYLSTGDAQYKSKADYLVAELKKCQDRATTVGFTAGYLSAFPESHVQNLENLTGAGTNTCWAPLYSIHKTIAGLLDCYQLLGNQTALTMATRIGDWIYARLSRYSQSHRESMWNYMPWNAGEYGGFNESMAKLYTITGSANHLAAAKFFDHARLFTPCANNQDQLSGLHANTQIPKIIGALEIFEATNTASYYAIAVNFWNMVVGAHSYANRGNSKAEYFKDPNSIAGQMGDDTTETCNTYNMLKLTRRLFFHDPSQAKYMDYYEQALYNHILGVQNPSASHGFSTYFTPLRAGGIRTYSNDYDSFTCCHSTGNTESQTKFQESIFFFTGETLYVNLFIPATLSWRARGITVTQATSFPEQNTTTLTIGGAGHIALKVRVPSWVQPGWQLKLNGAVQPIAATPGSYVTLDRTWANGDVVEITMPMALRLEATPDNASLKALFYGPILLAGAYGSNNLSQTPTLDASSIRTTATPLQFTATASGASVSLLPFYKLHGQRYAVYWYASALPTATATAVATRTAAPATPTATPAAPTATPATPTAAPTATPVAGAAYQVSYVLNQWGTGFTAEVTVKNASASAISGWALAWTFGGNQQVTSAWNATISPASGSVVASNVSYNASIPAGGSVSFGFQGSYSGTNSVPASFTLNGQPCTIIN